MSEVRMKKLIFCILFLMLVGSLAWSEVPKLFSYSGKLTDKTSTIVPDGDYDMVFALYTAATGGTAIWTENHDSPTTLIHVAAGAFNVILGGITTLPTFSSNYYLEMKFKKNTDPVSAYETFPRQQIVSVPYALQANDGTPQGAIIMWTGSTCPAGYTRLSQFDNLFPRGAASYGALGGSDTHTHGAVTGNGGVDHTHTYSATTSGVSATENVTGNGGQSVAGQWHTHTVSGTTSGSSAYLHTHPINADYNIPKYFTVVFCLKQ
jgi:hypothetical protein